MAFDLNAIRSEFNRLKSNGQSNFLDNFVPMPEGEGSVVIRLLPPKEGPLPYVATRTHKMNGKNFHCPMQLIGDRWQGNCPICNHYRSLWKQSEMVSSKDEVEALQNEARSIKPVERYYWNAIVRTITTKGGEVQHNVGPKIFSCGKQLNFKLVKAITGDDVVGLDGLGDVTDVAGKEGRDLRVIKRLVKGSGDEKYPNYNESVFLNPSKAGTDAEVASWLENLHDLNSLRRILPNEELARQVRIHRGEEEDTEIAYNVGGDEVEIEEAPVVQPPKQVRPSASAQVNRPTPVQKPKPSPVVSEDNDEAMMDDDFLSKLKSM